MAGGVAVTIAAITALTNSVPASAQASDAQSSLVETFEYPDAAAHTDIKLIKGDGHILLVGCDEGRTDVEVYSFIASTPYCFDVRGESGFLSLELEQAYGVRNYNDFTVDAKVSIMGRPAKTVTVPADDWAGVGVGGLDGQAVLAGLRY